MRIISSTAIAATLFVAASSLALAQTSHGSSSNTMSPATSATSGASGASTMSSGVPSTGAITSESQAKKQIEANGYTHILDVHHAGDGWAAKATKDGKQVSVMLDSAGKVSVE